MSAPEELLEPLRRTLGWLASMVDGEGRILCDEHRIEHTGKSAGAALLATCLWRHDRPEHRAAHLRFAVQQGRRLVANLQREGTSECHTFRPGRYDPFNNSNHVIDGGAASDALAELVLVLAGELEPADREAFAAASLLHARTYLRYAALDKGIPAQRAWGLSGLAAAWALEHDPDLERAALEAVGALEAIQYQDGSFPYHPVEWGAKDQGAADASSFYHGRIPAFVMFALERLGRDPTDRMFAGPLQGALRFAAALPGPDGIKCGLVEAKPWYWGAEYEVASHPFDVFAFARGGELFGKPDLSRKALSSFRAWAAHLGPEGRPASHRPGPHRSRSYQCPLFWAAHASWIGRALPDLERALAAEQANPHATNGAHDLSVLCFHDASVARLEDENVVAWVRGVRPLYNVHHGSPHVGLLRVVRKSDGAELVDRVRHAHGQAAEWSAAAGAPNPLRGWRACGRELRFSLWQARNHWRCRRPGEALGAPWHALTQGVGAFASAQVSTAFHLGAALECPTAGVRQTTGLAWRGGEPVPGVEVQRSFTLDGEGLRVAEHLRGAARVRGLRYVVPAAARDVRGPEPDGAGGIQVEYRLC